MTIGSSDYAAVVTACRGALAHGTTLGGNDLIRVIDVVEHAANTLDSQAAAAVAALEDELVTQMALWAAAGSGDSSAVYTAALAALSTLRTAATAAAAGSITDVTALDGPDGRTA